MKVPNCAHITNATFTSSLAYSFCILMPNLYSLLVRMCIYYNIPKKKTYIDTEEDSLNTAISNGIDVDKWRGL